MSLGLFNSRHEITVQAYKESAADDDDGYNTLRTKTTPIDLQILLMHNKSVEKRRENGTRYIQDSFRFQISSTEIDAKSFEIVRGTTFITYKGNNYRVKTVKDYRHYPFTRAMQCTAVRIIDVI